MYVMENLFSFSDLNLGDRRLRIRMNPTTGIDPAAGTCMKRLFPVEKAAMARIARNKLDEILISLFVPRAIHDANKEAKITLSKNGFTK
jgi:hypothetical protein